MIVPQFEFFHQNSLILNPVAVEKFGITVCHFEILAFLVSDKL
jgi:hypothetical protein